MTTPSAPSTSSPYTLLGTRKCAMEMLPETTPWTRDWLEAMFSTAEACGITVMRISFRMAMIQPERGRYNFGPSPGGDAGYDDLMRCARRHKIWILAEVPGKTPAWANGGNGVADGPCFSAGDVADYVWAIVSRFKQGGGLWTQDHWDDDYGLWGVEAHNEPNLKQFWNVWDASTRKYVGKREPFRYAEHLAAIYDAVKSADPRVLVCGFNLSVDGDIPGYVRDVFHAGLEDQYDAASVHPYYGFGGPPSQVVPGNVKLLTDALDLYGNDTTTPIWFTEFNAGKVPDNTTEQEQANRYLESYVTDYDKWKKNRVARMFIAYLHDTKSDTGGIVRNPARWPDPDVKEAYRVMRDEVPDML